MELVGHEYEEKGINLIHYTIGTHVSKNITLPCLHIGMILFQHDDGHFNKNLCK